MPSKIAQTWVCMVVRARLLHAETVARCGAGQIGLDPPTMQLVAGGPRAQAVRCLQSCQAVAIAVRSDIPRALLGCKIYASAVGPTQAAAQQSSAPHSHASGDSGSHVGAALSTAAVSSSACRAVLAEAGELLDVLLGQGIEALEAAGSSRAAASCGDGPQSCIGANSLSAAPRASSKGPELCSGTSIPPGTSLPPPRHTVARWFRCRSPLGQFVALIGVVYVRLTCREKLSNAAYQVPLRE